MNLALVENDPIQGSYKSNVKTSKVCQFPGCKETQGLEQHHINELKNLKKKGLHPYLKSLIAKKRETVTLCKVHHDLQHSKTGKTRVG
jgi:DNA-binding sugar fermentation-stimulating protein